MADGRMVRHVLSQATVMAPTKFESPVLGAINAVRSPACPHGVLTGDPQSWVPWPGVGCNPLFLELGSRSQANLCEFQASLVYIESSRTALAI